MLPPIAGRKTCEKSNIVLMREERVGFPETSECEFWGFRASPSPTKGRANVVLPPSGREVDFCEAKRRREPATIRKFVELPLSSEAVRKFLLSNVARPMAPPPLRGAPSRREPIMSRSGIVGRGLAPAVPKVMLHRSHAGGARGVPQNSRSLVSGVRDKDDSGRTKSKDLGHLTDEV